MSRFPAGNLQNWSEIIKIKNWPWIRAWLHGGVSTLFRVPIACFGFRFTAPMSSQWIDSFSNSKSESKKRKTCAVGIVRRLTAWLASLNALRPRISQRSAAHAQTVRNYTPGGCELKRLECTSADG